MIIKCVNDGTKYDKQEIEEKGFFLDEKRDITCVSNYDLSTGAKSDNNEMLYNFVGFVTNDNNDILVVFPKGFSPRDIENDSKKLFDCFMLHLQKNISLYIGEQADDIYKSNYPFSAFFNVYDYYIKYGLFQETKEFVRENAGGKVSWKDTINRSLKYFEGNELMIYPVYYKKKFMFSNFITECMIFVIDYTIEKFNTFISLEATEMPFPEYDFFENKEYVINTLYQIRQQSFKDIELHLIDNLIHFFEGLNIGGAYYFKHYSFAHVWEAMVMPYLKAYYKEISADKIVLDKTASKHLKFDKAMFHPNKAKKEQFISPDYYCSDGDLQLIFDAKYYTSFQGIDYKQVAYYFMLKEFHEKTSKVPMYKKTHTALISPSQKRETKIHFQMDDNFSFSDKDFIITEEYFDIHHVMDFYLGVD